MHSGPPTAIKKGADINVGSEIPKTLGLQSRRPPLLSHRLLKGTALGLQNWNPPKKRPQKETTNPNIEDCEKKKKKAWKDDPLTNSSVPSFAFGSQSLAARHTEEEQDVVRRC